MFTGIIQTAASVTAVESTDAGVRLAIDLGEYVPEGGRRPQKGDSVSVAGVCLTVAHIDGAVLAFDVVGETLARTTLGEVQSGDRVNIEPALHAGQPLGGHFVQGHIDGIGRVITVHDQDDDYRVAIEAPAGLQPYVMPKGSVAIDGVSLTVAEVDERGGAFTVALIPTTLELTTLSDLVVGSRVNLEADILAKTVVRTLRQMLDRDAPGSVITRQTLESAGFL